jgi:hypothetical protein
MHTSWELACLSQPRQRQGPKPPPTSPPVARRRGGSAAARRRAVPPRSLPPQRNDARRRALEATRLLRSAQEPWRDVPALAVVADDSHGLPIVASQHADEPAMSVRLKGDAIADLELEHVGVRSHLSQELEPGNDSVVQVDEFRLGQPIDVDPHAHPAH